MGLLCGPSLSRCPGSAAGPVLTGLRKSPEDIDSRHFKRCGLGGARTHNQRLKRAHSRLCKYPLIKCLYITFLSCSSSVALDHLLPSATPAHPFHPPNPASPTHPVLFNPPIPR